MAIDLEAPLRFLHTAFRPDDWIAVLLKSHDTGGTAQRVGPMSLIASSKFPAESVTSSRGPEKRTVNARSTSPTQAFATGVPSGASTVPRIVPAEGRTKRSGSIGSVPTTRTIRSERCPAALA